MPVFESPLWFLAVIPVVILIGLFHCLGGRGVGVAWSFRVSGQKVYVPGPVGYRIVAACSYVSFWLGVVALIVTLANPQSIKTEKIYLSRGAATVVVLDDSPSMAIKDGAGVSRFDSARAAVAKFASARENDLLGLVTFGKEAAMRCPLTSDYEFFNKILYNARIMEMGDGTGVGMGLSLAALHLSRNSNPVKNVILLTDGANNSGEIHPDAAVEMLSSLGIRTFVVGLGKRGDYNVSFVDPISGKEVNGLVKDAYDEKLLESIANRTGGEFFRIETFSTFESIFQSLDATVVGQKRVKLHPRALSYRINTLIFAAASILLTFTLRVVVLREAL